MLINKKYINIYLVSANKLVKELSLNGVGLDLTYMPHDLSLGLA